MVRISSWRERQEPVARVIPIARLIEPQLQELSLKLAQFAPDRTLNGETSSKQTIDLIDLQIEVGTLLKQSPIWTRNHGPRQTPEISVEIAIALPKSREELTERLIARFGGVGRTIDLFLESVNAVRQDERFIVREDSSTAQRFKSLAVNISRTSQGVDDLSKIALRNPTENLPQTHHAVMGIIRFLESSPLGIRRTLEAEAQYLGYPGLELPPEKRLKYPPRHFAGVHLRPPPDQK